MTLRTQNNPTMELQYRGSSGFWVQLHSRWQALLQRWCIPRVLRDIFLIEGSWSAPTLWNWIIWGVPQITRSYAIQSFVGNKQFFDSYPEANQQREACEAEVLYAITGHAAAFWTSWSFQWSSKEVPCKKHCNNHAVSD